jgi:hypothetical protein
MAKFRELALLLTSIATVSWIAHSRTNVSTQVPGQVQQTSDLGHGIILVLSQVPDSAQSAGELNLPAGHYASLVQGGKVVYLSPPEQLGFLREQHPAGRPSAKDPDLLGNGHPQLLLRGLNAATYEHHNLYLFDLTPEDGPPKLIFRQDIEEARVVDLDGDGRSEILAADPDVGGPRQHPTFVYRVDPTGLQISPELMRRLPAPKQSEIDQVMADVRKSLATGEKPYYSLPPYSTLIYTAHRLLYSGNAKAEENALDSIWDIPQREAYMEFSRALHQNLTTSKAWPAVRKINGWENGYRNYNNKWTQG